MCLILNPVKVYKVLKPDFMSPYMNVQWSRDHFSSNRMGPLTLEEMRLGFVKKGLHFYRSLEDCVLEPGLIVVECTSTSIIAVAETACIAMHCWVGDVVRGKELVKLYEKNNWTSIPHHQPYYVSSGVKTIDLRRVEEWKKCA